MNNNHSKWSIAQCFNAENEYAKYNYDSIRNHLNS